MRVRVTASGVASSSIALEDKCGAGDFVKHAFARSSETYKTDLRVGANPMETVQICVVTQA
jgi:hypothetical protein